MIELMSVQTFFLYGCLSSYIGMKVGRLYRSYRSQRHFYELLERRDNKHYERDYFFNLNK